MIVYNITPTLVSRQPIIGGAFTAKSHLMMKNYGTP